MTGILAAPEAGRAAARGRIFFLDPSLGRSGGHHTTVAENYASLLASAGRTLVFVGNRSPRPELTSGLPNFVPAFDYCLEDAFRVTLRAWPWLANRRIATLARLALRGIGASNGAAARPMQATARALSLEECRALVAPLGAARALTRAWAERPPGPSDDVVLLAADPALMAALHERPDRANLNIVFMHMKEQVFGAKTWPGFSELYRAVCAPPSRLYVESSLLAEDLQTSLGVSAAEIVPPTRIVPMPRKPLDGAFVVVCLGAGRADKGFPLLPGIAQAARARGLTANFRVQEPMPDAGLHRCVEQLLRDPSVVLLPRRLSADEYEAELSGAHVVLLPYDRNVFARRGSGVLTDALTAGRPIVCTAGSALAPAVAFGNGLAADGASGFAEALQRIYDAYESYAAAAQRRADAVLSAVREGPLIRRLLRQAD